VSTAVRAWFLGAFTTGQGYAADADSMSQSRQCHRLLDDTIVADENEVAMENMAPRKISAGNAICCELPHGKWPFVP